MANELDSSFKVNEFELQSRCYFPFLTYTLSHSTNTLGKGMSQIIPPPAMGK